MDRLTILSEISDSVCSLQTSLSGWDTLSSRCRRGAIFSIFLRTWSRFTFCESSTPVKLHLIFGISTGAKSGCRDSSHLRNECEHTKSYSHEGGDRFVAPARKTNRPSFVPRWRSPLSEETGPRLRFPPRGLSSETKAVRFPPRAVLPFQAQLTPKFAICESDFQSD